MTETLLFRGVRLEDTATADVSVQRLDDAVASLPAGAAA